MAEKDDCSAKTKLRRKLRGWDYNPTCARALLNVDYGGMQLFCREISKRENSLGYIGGQVNSLTGLPSLIFSPKPGEVNC